MMQHDMFIVSQIMAPKNCVFIASVNLFANQIIHFFLKFVMNRLKQKIASEIM